VSRCLRFSFSLTISTLPSVIRTFPLTHGPERYRRWRLTVKSRVSECEARAKSSILDFRFDFLFSDHPEFESMHFY
jgi:hypothetical protein